MRSLVIPVYRNEETIAPLLKRLRGLHRELGGDLEVVFVVDASPDRCYELLRADLPDSPFPSQLVRLSRNFGSFAAIRLGLEVAEGSQYAVLSADLQEPIELIVEFFRLLAEEPLDIVFGERKKRSDPAGSRWSSATFWWLYRRLIENEMPAGGVDVFACNKPVRDVLLSMGESNSSLVGQLFWLGFRRRAVPYERQPRPVGRSAWTFRKKVRYLLDSLYSFTDLPIRLLTLVGALGLVLSMLVSGVVMFAWWSDRIRVSGYTPLILAIMFSTFLLLLGIGVIGNYVARTFENSKARPLVVPMSHETFQKEKGHAAIRTPTGHL